MYLNYFGLSKSPFGITPDTSLFFEGAERGDVLELTADQMGVMPFEVPDGAQLQRLSPAVRQLVLQYFERLNRVTVGGGGGGS